MDMDMKWHQSQQHGTHGHVKLQHKSHQGAGHQVERREINELFRNWHLTVSLCLKLEHHIKIAIWGYTPRGPPRSQIPEQDLHNSW